MQRYPDNTPAAIEDFRQSGWRAAIDSSDRDGYSSMWSALSVAARTAIEGGKLAEGRVLWLLADACSLTLRPGSFNEPFKPRMVTHHGRSALPEDFQESDIALLAQISEEANDPWLQGRLADLVWLLEKPRHPKYALLAIDAYRTIPLDVQTWLRDGRECWERAITLSRMLGIGAGGRLKEIEAVLMAAFGQTTKDDGFHALWLTEPLAGNHLGKEESRQIAEKLRSMAQIFDQEMRFHHSRSFFDASARWFKRAGDVACSIEMTVQLAEGWVKEAMQRMSSTQRSSAVAASFYESAIQVYRTIPRRERAVLGIQNRIAEMHKLMNQAAMDALDEMGRVTSGPIDITTYVEKAQNSVRGKIELDALAALANLHAGCRVTELRQRSEEMLRIYISPRLFGSTHLSSDGRVIAKQPAAGTEDANSEEYEAAVRSEMVRDHTMRLDLLVRAVVWPALTVVISEHRLREGDFVALADRSPIVPRGRGRLFGKALFLGYEGDFAAALHLLVPQIEHMVRCRLKAAGVKTTNLDEDGIENEKALGALVDFPETAQILGEDLAFKLKALFCDALGPNLRNELAHGLLEYGACESTYSIYAWWLGLKLVVNAFWNATRTSDVREPPAQQN